MTPLVIIATISTILNIFLVWYLVKILRKFLFISEALADLYLTFRSFEVFTKSLYNMDMFYGEPIIQELIQKSKVVLEEVERFRDTFEYTLDEEIEEELNEIESAAEEKHEEPLFHEGP
tara:strand:+ start:20785 stop:21141 length:357 start_codon:yes stop_codon:yes gene_type:complete